MTMIAKLAYLKRRDKLTTEDIAVRTGIPIGTLNKIFAGQTHNPALRAMDAICQLFRVPVHYLMDDSIPVECSLMAYTESLGMLSISPPELDCFLQYRTLTPRDQRCVEQMLTQFSARMPPRDTVVSERLLPCYEPIAQGRRGAFADAWSTRTIRAPLDQVTREADSAIVVSFGDLVPIYTPGTILAFRNCNCTHQQLGVFLLNGEAYIRKLWQHRNTKRLVSLQSGQSDVWVTTHDNFSCLGTVVGAVRTYQYI